MVESVRRGKDWPHKMNRAALAAFLNSFGPGLYLIAGRPAGGKSWACIEMAHRAVWSGKHVYYCCPDAPWNKALMPRLFQLGLKAGTREPAGKIIVSERPFNQRRLFRGIRARKAVKDISLVIVDSVAGVTRKSGCLRGLKELALELALPIVVAGTLTRAAGAGPDRIKKLSLRGLREPGMERWIDGIGLVHEEAFWPRPECGWAP